MTDWWVNYFYIFFWGKSLGGCVAYLYQEKTFTRNGATKRLDKVAFQYQGN
jgi:hypothetical protein